MSSGCEWTTRLDPHATARFGCTEVHAVAFKPLGDLGGASNAVVVEIPETPEHLIRDAFAAARTFHARLLFLCDTAKQARHIAHRASKALPAHRRVPLELASVGMWGALS